MKNYSKNGVSSICGGRWIPCLNGDPPAAARVTDPILHDLPQCRRCAAGAVDRRWVQFLIEVLKVRDLYVDTRRETSSQ